jgi:putative hydrolase of the HAD superfamily
MSKNRTDLPALFADAYAVIWDMDGVLIDSESYHFAAHVAALSEFGITLTEAYYKEYGVSVDPQLFYKKAFADAKKSFDDLVFLKVHYRKIALYQKQQRDHGIKLIAPAATIVKRLYNNGVLMAIASQVDREEVTRNLRGTGLLEFFPIIVSGGDFGLKKKPAPDIYKKAVEILNVEPAKCVAIEDSIVGVKSALAAGVPCLAVPNEFTKHQKFPEEAIITDFSAIAKAI